MKKTFQKNLVAAAVAMVASVGVHAADVGQANLLFPFITTASTAFTFVTITNRNASTAADVAGNNMTVTVPLNFKYGVKDIAAANSTGCFHSDSSRAQTANDVMQFEVGGKVNMGPIGNEGTTSTTTTSTYSAYTTPNRQGFLVVNANGATAALGGVRLYGEATIVDTATGLSTTYSSRGLNTSDAADPDFTIDNLGLTGGPEVAVNGPYGTAVRLHGRNVVTWMADTVAATSWFVEPLGKVSSMTPSFTTSGAGIVAGYSMFSDLQLQAGAYDMNEQFWSGGTRTDVRCVGTITRQMMLNEDAYLNTRFGGTANLTFFNSATTVDGTRGIDGAPAGGVAALTALTIGQLADNSIPGAAAYGSTANAHKSLAYKIISSTALGATKTTVSREAHY